ncbi:hypothetical protein D3C71_1540130 [compost metagenome]
MRPRDGQRMGHHRPVGRLPRHRHPVGGHRHDVRAAHRQHPVDLGKPAVIADGDAQAAQFGMEHRQAQVPGFEIQVFVTPQMQLAVGTDVAGGACDQRGVVQPVAAAFGDARHQINAQPLRQRDPGLRTGAARHGLGQRIGLFAALEHIARVGQFGQHHQPRALRGGLLHQFGRAGDVGSDFTDHGSHLHTGHPGRLVRGMLRVRRLHAISLFGN